MHRNTLTSFSRVAVAAAAAAAIPALAGAEQIFGLTTQNSIVVIDSDNSSVAVDGGFVSGLDGGEFLLDIDYRPGTGDVYAISSADNVYIIDQNDFSASLVGNFAPPSLRGTSFAFDFNNAFDGGSGDPDDVGRFARIISNTDDNVVIDGDTGLYLGGPKTDAFYAAGDVNEGADPNVVGIAYTNAVPGADSTQQFGIDLNTGALVTVANNAGTLETVGSLGLSAQSTFTNEAALDISGATGTAFAVLEPAGGVSELYVVDLDSGAASSVGLFDGNDTIRSLTVVPVPEPTSLALLGVAGLGLVRRRR